MNKLLACLIVAVALGLLGCDQGRIVGEISGTVEEVRLEDGVGACGFYVQTKQGMFWVRANQGRYYGDYEDCALLRKGDPIYLYFTNYGEYFWMGSKAVLVQGDK